MASLDAALSRLAIALDALETRLPAALSAARGPHDVPAELAQMRLERTRMEEEIDRLRGEVRALDDLHEEMSNRLESAMREVELVIAE